MYSNNIDIYYGILSELNKYSSPSFETEDFEKFVNSAVLDYIKKRYSKSELKLKVIADLNPITVRDEEIVLNAAIAGYPFYYSQELPTNYMYMLLVVSEIICVENGQSRPLKPKETPLYTEDIKGFGTDNPYWSPKPFRPYYQIEKNEQNASLDNIQVMIGNEERYQVTRVWVSYIQRPNKITVDLDNPNNPVNELSPIFSKPEIADEIINEASLKFLESIESRRTQSYPEVNKQSNWMEP